MIKESTDGTALTFRGKSGPSYTARKDEIIKLADSALPSSLATIALAVLGVIESFHFIFSLSHEGDLAPNDIHSGLGGLIVLCALRHEQNLLRPDPDGRLKLGRCNARRNTWWCTLPSGHGVEHVAHVPNDDYSKVSVCTRWPVENDKGK